jgi:hypothetical protein
MDLVKSAILRCPEINSDDEGGLLIYKVDHSFLDPDFAFTMSPVPLLSFDDARHRPLGCPVWRSL